MRGEEILRRKGSRIGAVRPGEAVETALRLLTAGDLDALTVEAAGRAEDGAAVGLFIGVITDRGLIKAPVGDPRAYAVETWDFPVAAHQ